MKHMPGAGSKLSNASWISAWRSSAGGARLFVIRSSMLGSLQGLLVAPSKGCSSGPSAHYKPRPAFADIAGLASAFAGVKGSKTLADRLSLVETVCPVHGIEPSYGLQLAFVTATFISSPRHLSSNRQCDQASHNSTRRIACCQAVTDLDQSPVMSVPSPDPDLDKWTHSTWRPCPFPSTVQDTHTPTLSLA